MTEKLQDFRRNIDAAVEEGEEAEHRLVDRLKEKTAEELVRLPRELLDDLSDEDYRAVVSHVAPNHELREPQFKEPKRHRRRFRDLWLILPGTVRALLTGGAVGTVILIIGLTILPAIDRWRALTPPVRSTNTLSWPSCERLNKWVDGCTYRMTSNAAWEMVARQLALPPSYLRLVNRHVASQSIPSGSLLVVWRERAPLKGGR